MIPWIWVICTGTAFNFTNKEEHRGNKKPKWLSPSIPPAYCFHAVHFTLLLPFLTPNGRKPIPRFHKNASFMNQGDVFETESLH